MVTRREILGAGLAFASGAVGLCCASGVSAAPKVGAMVFDERLGISNVLLDLLRIRMPDLSLHTTRLDSFTSIELAPIFDSARMIAGISSGATLFCLERIAWDHGYRVTRRSEHELDPNVARARKNDETVLALADAILSNKPESFAAAIVPASHAYRPSMTDDTLHAWVMQMAVTTKKRTV